MEGKEKKKYEIKKEGVLQEVGNTAPNHPNSNPKSLSSFHTGLFGSDFSLGGPPQDSDLAR